MLAYLLLAGMAMAGSAMPHPIWNGQVVRHESSGGRTRIDRRERKGISAAKSALHDSIKTCIIDFPINPTEMHCRGSVFSENEN